MVETADNFLEDVFNNDDEDEENAPPIETEENENTSNDSSSGTDNGDTSSSSDDSSDTDENTTSDSTTTTSDTGSNTNTGNTTDGTTSDSGTGSESTTDSEVVIIHNGEEYRNGAIIEVLYDKNNSDYAFTLKNYPEGATFNWQVLKSGTDNTAAYVTNEPKYDNLGIDMKKEYLLDVVAYYNNQNIRVTIRRKLQDFTLADIYAAPENNQKRAAKTGEILYLAKSASVLSAERKVDFSVYIKNKNLSQADISSQAITWYYDLPNTQYNLGKDFGQKDIHLNLTEQDEPYSVKVKAGNPNLLEKGIEVVWFDKEYNKTSLTVESASNPFLKKLMEATKMTEKASDLFDKIPFVKRVKDKNDFTNGSIGWYYKIIPFERTVENKEDSESRLYYTEKKTKGGFEIGLKGRVNIWTWGLPWDKIPIPDAAKKEIKDVLTAEISIVAGADVRGELIGEQIEKKKIESNEWETVSKGVNPAAVSLNVQFGVEGELSAFKDNEVFSFSVTASGLARAELYRIGWYDNKFDHILLKEGVWMDFNANAYVIFAGLKLETEPFYEKVQLIEPKYE